MVRYLFVKNGKLTVNTTSINQLMVYNALQYYLYFNDVEAVKVLYKTLPQFTKNCVNKVDYKYKKLLKQIIKGC